MADVNFLRNKNIIGGDIKEKKIGGISKNKLLKVYLQLRANCSEEINFRVLSFENFIDFVLANGYDEEDVKLNNIRYELNDSVYAL